MYEVKQWAKYIEKRGSLNAGMRVEKGIALLATMIANLSLKKNRFKIYDFMEHEGEPPISIEEARKKWH